MRHSRQAASDHATPPRRAARLGDRETFFRHWLRDPLGIGAVAPSGSRVAQAMARQVDLTRPGTVLELGGGTGAVTRALLAAGCPADRLTVVEREPALAAHLRRRCPGVRVIRGDACDAERLLAFDGVTTLSTVVSSLPIKWFPRAAQRALLDACFARLGADGAFVQLTNALASPLAAAELGLSGEEVARIWAHFLPTQIWRYRRVATAQSAS
jgi:phosphatidylethanolamine/phosphatidyl-N-methylethanolamine N-methyltransferase